MHPIVKPVGFGCLLPAALFFAVVARDVWVDGRSGPFVGPKPLLVVPYTSYATADAGVGDLDGDGVPDLLIGSSRPGLVAEVASGATGETILRLTSEVAAREGRVVAAAGDCNGDGIGDVLVAHDVRAEKTRRVALYSGADGDELLAWEGVEGGRHGSAILGPGDLDGDGLGDVVIGVSGAGYVEARSGRDGSRLHRLEAPAEGTSFGKGLVRLGDLDGDARAELGILDELKGDDRLHIYSTASWEHSLVLADSEDGLRVWTTQATNDENGDGVRDLLVGARSGARIVSGADGAPLRGLLTGMTSPNAVPIGDYDGDGADDLLVRTWDIRDIGWVLELNAYAAVRVVSGRTEQLLFDVSYRHPFPRLHGPVDLNADGCSDFWVAFNGELRAYSR